MIAFVIFVFLTVLAGCFGMLAGFGLSTILLPMLLLQLPYAQALLLVGIIHWFHSGWKILFFYRGIDWRLFVYFGVGATIFSIVGASLVGQNVALLPAFLGFFLVAYALLIFIHPTFRVPRTQKNIIVGGCLSGFFAGVFGIRGSIRSAFLASFNLPKATYIGTTGAISLLVDTVRIATYWWYGLRLEPVLQVQLIFLLPASFLGAYLGSKLVGIIPQHYFRTVVAIFLMLMGVRLIMQLWIG